MAIASKDADSVLDEVNERRRRARKAGWTVAIGVVLSAMLARNVGLSWSRGSASYVNLGIVLLLTGSAMMAAFGIGRFVFLRRMSAPGLVVWLRRFRPGYEDRIRFHLVLGVACFGLASPVTIQDSSFKFSVQATSRQQWIIGPLMGMLSVVGIVLLTTPILVDPPPSRGGGLLLIFAWLGLVSVVVYRVLRHLGVVSRNWSAEQVANHLDAVRRGHRLLGNGVEVLKVARTGDEWKVVIREALARADLAIIDVSDVTEAIIWEIGQALRQLHRDRILLVAEERSVRAHALRKRLADEGLTASTQYWIERALLFYPAARKKGVPAKRAQQIDFQNRLRREVAWRLSTPTDAEMHGSAGRSAART